MRARVVFLLTMVCSSFSCSPQRYHDFTIRTPMPENHFLILGFQGGRESWDDKRPGVARLAEKLRSLGRSDLYVEVVENQRRDIALQLVKSALDSDQNGQLSEGERRTPRVVLYGMSFGGAAVIKMARQLQQIGIPVLLTVQVDSVGRNDAVVPANVRCAANLYQRNGKIIRGEPMIVAESPHQTVILGNFQYDYREKQIDTSAVPWHKKIFREDHARMDRDPDVWQRVEELILDAVSKE